MAMLPLVALFALSACTQTLVERAIEARGGSMASYRKEVDAQVALGIPGEWSWEVAYRVPESFRWTLYTFGEEQRLLYDGTHTTHQLGSATLPPSTADEGVRSQAHWFAVTSLDVLEGPGVTWAEMPASGLPPGVARGLSARFDGHPGAFDLFFDERGLLRRARGPVSMQPVGAGWLEATFSDYREVDGYRLPFSGEYRLDDQPLMRETVRHWTPNDPSIDATYFSFQ